MNPGRPVIALARAVSMLLGLGLLAAGAYGVAVWAGTSPAREWSLYLDRNWYYTAPQQSWWPWGLVAVAVASVLVGIAVLIACVRPRRASRTVLADDADGLCSVDTGAVCDAVAAEVAALEHVRGAEARTRLLRGDVTCILEVRASAEADIDRLRAGLADAAGNLAAVLGDRAPRLRILLEPDKPERPRAAERGLA